MTKEVRNPNYRKGPHAFAALFCPEGTSENSPAFQRWVGRAKVPSPEGTTEACLRRSTKCCSRQVQSHTPSFSRPFGTCEPCGMFPGVKTPGYSQDVPPGHRNVAAAFSAKQATRFISDAVKGISWPRYPAMNNPRSNPAIRISCFVILSGFVIRHSAERDELPIPNTAATLGDRLSCRGDYEPSARNSPRESHTRVAHH